MQIGVAKEIKSSENRIAVTPPWPRPLISPALRSIFRSLTEKTRATRLD